MTKRIAMVLIDDNPSASEGVAALIRAEPGFHVLAVSAEIEQALQIVRETKPDLVLLNLPSRGDLVLAVAGALHGKASASRVVVMGLQPRHEDVASYVRAGVSGFIMADASFDRLLDTIHAVANGIQILPSELTGSLFGQINGHGVGRGPKSSQDLERLTTRERAVTNLIIQGLSNKDIAVRLSIALHTVKSHVHKVLSKLSVNSRLEVAAFSRNAARGATMTDRE